MAATDSSKDDSKEMLTLIQTRHDEAFLYISQGLSYQEQNKYELASDMYNKGLNKINEALNVRCDRAHCIGSQWDKARSMQQKMRKTLQMAKDQLQKISILTKDFSPPSYAEACRDTVHSNGRRSSCPVSSNGDINNLGTKISDTYVSSNSPVNSSVSEVSEIFGISDGVQLFFVSASDAVTTLSSSTSLHVYKFKEERPQAANMSQMLPSGWLQVGEWTYPLVPGQSPALESGYGAFLFPDINSNEDGAVVAIMFPADIDLETRQVFKMILKEMTDLEEEEGCAQAESFSDTLSRGIVTGAEYLSAGLAKGATITGEYIHKGANIIKQKIHPDSTPTEVDPKLQQGLKIAKDASTVALTVSSYLACKLSELTMALGTKLAPHIREQGAKLLTSALDKKPEDAKQTMDNMLKVAAGGFQGFSTMYCGLQNAATLLAVSLSKETVDVVDYKYGKNAGEAVGNAVSAVGNLALATHNVKMLGPKSIVKKTAKDAGKAVLQDYVEKKEQQPPK